jgi:hypothetical protein
MSDNVNNPSHYTRFKGIEVIQLTEQLNFCRGNAVKYIARAGAKDSAKEIEDLQKAIWYINREIDLLKSEESTVNVNEAFANIAQVVNNLTIRTKQ